VTSGLAMSPSSMTEKHSFSRLFHRSSPMELMRFC
jgi:hypothetical protein